MTPLVFMPKRYLTYFPIETKEEMEFCSNKRDIIVIIDLHIYKSISSEKYKILLAGFKKENIFVELKFFKRFPKIVLDKTICYKVLGNLVQKEDKFCFHHPKILNKFSLEKMTMFAIYSPDTLENAKQQRSIEGFLDSRGWDDKKEWIPLGIVEEMKWPSFLNSIKIINFPMQFLRKDFSNQKNYLFLKYKINKSTERLIFDELICYYSEQFALRSGKDCVQQVRGEHTENFLSQWVLKPSQFQALKEIEKDMGDKKRMFRLLYGEVGSGKTIIAFAAALIALDSGNQSAIIAPTRILAKQLYERFISQMPEVSCVFVDSDSKLKKDAQIVIGTHSVFNFPFKKLGLVVFDEQHKFGVKQRGDIIQNSAADVLFMSATPIPRTLFMAKHKFIEVSYMDHSVDNIKSYVCSSAKIDKALQKIPDWLNRKEKIFWVCAAINNFKTIIGCLDRYETLKKITDKISLVHGKQSPEEAQENIERFSNQEVGVLVATSIIETGINIPDSSIMVIENAERFGVAQLHQLRGRVGRNGQKAHCLFLFSELEENLENSPREKLNFIAQNQKGLLLAEFDLEQRGSGNIKGYKQQGKTRWVFCPKKIPTNITNLAAEFHQKEQSSLQPTYIKEFFSIKPNTLIS